jgi:hypothetical protein
MQLHQGLGFHSGINNLHFLQFYDIKLGYRRFKSKLWSHFQKAKMTKKMLLLKIQPPFFFEKFGKQLPNEEGL